MNEDKKYDLIVILINIINGVVVIRLRSWWNDGARCIANTEKEKKMISILMILCHCSTNYIADMKIL